jgi:hypothetical protein
MADLTEWNSLKTEINAALIASLQHGPAFLVNTRGDESIGEPPSLIHVKDALNATGEWNPRKRRLDNLLSITGRDGDGKVTSLALYLDGVTITAEKDSSGWSVDRTEHPWGVPAEVMAYKPQPRRPFGASRISRPIMSLHDQGLRTVIRMEGNADVYSFPQMVAPRRRRVDLQERRRVGEGVLAGDAGADLRPFPTMRTRRTRAPTSSSSPPRPRRRTWRS